MDMQDQPKFKAYSKGSIRKPVEGTVPRGYLREDKQLYTGKKEGGQASAVSSTPPAIQSAIQLPGAKPLAPAAMYPDAVDTFPFPITEAIVTRGQERYNVYCGMCHGPTGYGDGMIVRRGFRRPPSYHTDQLRQAPVGHFFDVITNGWATMPSYAAMIPVTDRWAIVAYVRALQLSQNPQGATTAGSTSAATQASPTQRDETRGQR
jgi:mono/diheme cytochrome c family protein